MYNASFVVLGGKELEQARHRVVVRSIAFLTTDEDEEYRYGYMTNMGQLVFAFFSKSMFPSQVGVVVHSQQQCPSPQLLTSLRNLFPPI